MANKSNMLFLIVIFLSLSKNIEAASQVIQKKINVQIISGTYTGEKGTAIVRYNKKQIKGVGKETINNAPVSFKFLGQTVNGTAQVILSNGKFKDLMWVGSIKNKEGMSFNFGFNAGFSRGQFNRLSEAFILKGDSYFGYLFPSTYVDGAGRVSYSNHRHKAKHSIK